MLHKLVTAFAPPAPAPEMQARRRPRSSSIAAVPGAASRQAASAAPKIILNAFPLPNGAPLTNQQAVFAAGFSNPLTTDATSFRLDRIFSSKLNASGRYQ